MLTFRCRKVGTYRRAVEKLALEFQEKWTAWYRGDAEILGHLCEERSKTKLG